MESQGINIIAEERARHITEEGYTAELDDEWENEELAQAAATYVYPERMAYPGREEVWPENWDLESFKPTPNDRIRELAKAGALIAAEIDRLLRKKVREDKIINK